MEGGEEEKQRDPFAMLHSSLLTHVTFPLHGSHMPRSCFLRNQKGLQDWRGKWGNLVCCIWMVGNFPAAKCGEGSPVSLLYSLCTPLQWD